MSNDALDWSPYRTFHTTPTARAALRVTRALDDLHDAGATGAVKRNRERMMAAHTKLRDALDRRGAPAETESSDGRPVDNRADRVWGALEMRLHAWVLLGALLGAEHAKVKRAAELLAAIFASGTEFLKLPFAEQEEEMDRLLRLIDSSSLEHDLVSLAGREFVDALSAVQPEYAAMVRAMLERDAQKERVVGLVRNLVVAVEEYAGSVLGDVDSQSAASVKHTRKLLTPLANFRAASASASASEPDPAPPAAPAPTPDPAK